MLECAFCSETANLSLEHIIPQWVEKLFPGESKVKYNDGKGRTAEWKTDKIDWKARVVCSTCNSGWMSDLESQHAMPVLTPLITGKSLNIAITQEVARSIALFAFKTAVVMDHSQRRGNPWFSRNLRHAFREHQTMSSGIEMWMCANLGRRRAIDLQAGYFSGNPTPSYPVQSYVCTVGIGYLVFQVHSAKHFGYTKLYPVQTFDAVAVPFWPRLPEGLVWPFPGYLSGKADFDAFHMRWSPIGHDRLI
jgi:hypothetical protein